MTKRKTSKAQPRSTATSPAGQIAGFIGKFEPGIARLIRACRTEMRRRLPSAVELVYDNYNFFVIGYCTSQRASSCVCSLACSAKGVALSFYNGAKLQDPSGILQGGGKQNRFVRLTSVSTLREPAVAALIAKAAAGATPPLPQSGRGRTVVKSVSAKQRPRRATSAATSAGQAGRARFPARARNS